MPDVDVNFDICFNIA